MGYSILAKYYDRFMGDFPYHRWGEFIISKIDASQPTVELACGTGNLTIELCKKGLNIEGIDIDENMLSIAKEKVLKQQLNLEFYVQDMVEADLRGYKNIICPCDGVNSLTTPQLRSFLKNIAQNFQGTFIFDFSTKKKLQNLHGQIYYEDYEDITYFWESEYDQISQEVNLYLTFFEKLRNGYYNREDVVISQKGLTISGVKKLLEEFNIDIKNIYDDYTEKEAREDSERVVIVCCTKK